MRPTSARPATQTAGHGERAGNVERRWCFQCEEWVVPLSDGKGCPYCWAPTISSHEKERIEREAQGGD